MKTYNELKKEEQKLNDDELLSIEQEQRNAKRFKHWARSWYHRYHVLPVRRTEVSL